jgi:hypothetical protein
LSTSEERLQIDAVRVCVESELGPVDRPSQHVVAARLAFALVAREDARTTLEEIGRVLGVGARGVRQLIRKAGRRRSRDVEFAAAIEAARRRLDQLRT